MSATSVKRTGVRVSSSCDLEVILFVFARALAERVKPGEHLRPEDVFAAVSAVHEEVKGAYSVVAILADGGGHATIAADTLTDLPF